MQSHNSLDKVIHDEFIAPLCSHPFKILYQDNDILLIDKPSGLLSLSGKNPRNWDSLHYRLVNGQVGVTPPFPMAKLPHRLDFGTSGVMVVALHQGAAKALNRQFQNRTVRKRYLAMLEGKLKCGQGEINVAIAKDSEHFPRVKICAQTGREAISEFEVLKRLEEPAQTLVQYTPHTGRTHQLRIHSLYMGHPILGCDLYHSATSLQRAERLLLHASDLYFEHPGTGEQFVGHSPCPF